MKKMLFQVKSTLCVATVYGIPAVMVASMFSVASSRFEVITAGLLSVPVFVVGMVLTGGILSMPYHKYIVAGKFRRDLTSKLYAGRRIYGICWTTLFYCKPVYSIALSVEPIRTMMFRMYGYKGQMDFTVYPDTWMRDLPLLNFGKGAYISNRSTLGTNMVTQNGFILVDKIEVGENSTVGHLAMLAPGTIIGDNSKLGVGSMIGAKARVGSNVDIAHACAIGHYVRIEENVSIGGGAYVDSKVIVPAKTVMAPRSTVLRFNNSPSTSGVLDESVVNLPIDSNIQYRKSA